MDLNIVTGNSLPHKTYIKIDLYLAIKEIK